MKEINCNIIKDILPLYVDDVVSPDTKELVEEHLKNCKTCREEAAVMGREIQIPAALNVRFREIDILKKLKRNIRSKRVRVCAASILCTIAVFIGAHIALIDITKVVPYDSSLVSVEITENKVYAEFNRDSYAGISAINPCPVKVNGEEKKIVIFYYEDNLWAKYVEPMYRNKEKQDKKNQDKRFFLGNADEIDAVYYGEFPGADIYRELPAFLEDKEIIWSR